jgi:opacity protein-like surface antigen
MRSFTAAGALLVALSAGAIAADAPNIVGTWTPTGRSAARVGNTAHYPSAVKPSLTKGTDDAFKWRIDAQDGGSFSGTATGPKGKNETIVGAFRQDGKRFVFSTGNGNGSGEVSGDDLEFCWTDNIPSYIAAGCTTYKRSK